MFHIVIRIGLGIAGIVMVKLGRDFWTIDEPLESTLLTAAGAAIVLGAILLH